MRRILNVLVLLSVLLATSSAYGGSYLDRAALLLADAKRSNDWVLAHLGDKDLATMAREVAEGRVRAARGMQVPKDVQGVHPHLLMMMENSERAAAAAAEGDNEKFLHHLRTARDEDATFRGLLAQQKLTLPNVDKR